MLSEQLVNGMRLLKNIFLTSVYGSVVVLLNSCGRGRVDSDQQQHLKFTVVMPASFRDLTFEGIEMKTSGIRQSEISNEGEYNEAEFKTVLFNKACFDSRKAILGYAVIVLQKRMTNEIDLLLCGQPPVCVEYSTNSDYFISSRSDNSFSLLIKCTRK